MKELLVVEENKTDGICDFESSNNSVRGFALIASVSRNVGVFQNGCVQLFGRKMADR